jgi:hypothetical protein
MNIGVVVIITIALLLVGFLVLPRMRGFASNEKTTIERRAGADRRKRKIRVPRERRHKGRRQEDVAKTFVEGLTN